MPGVHRTYWHGRKKRKRRTHYRYVNVREHDWYNIHRLSDKLGLTIVDTFGLLVAKNLEALHVDPLTAEGFVSREGTGLDRSDSGQTETE